MRWSGFSQTGVVSIHRPQGSTRIRLYPQRLVYDLLEAFNVAQTNLSDETMRDIGLVQSYDSGRRNRLYER